MEQRPPEPQEAKKPEEAPAAIVVSDDDGGPDRGTPVVVVVDDDDDDDTEQQSAGEHTSKTTALKEEEEEEEESSVVYCCNCGRSGHDVEHCGEPLLEETVDEEDAAGESRNRAYSWWRKSRRESDIYGPRVPVEPSLTPSPPPGFECTMVLPRGHEHRARSSPKPSRRNRRTREPPKRGFERTMFEAGEDDAGTGPHDHIDFNECVTTQQLRSRRQQQRQQQRGDGEGQERKAEDGGGRGVKRTEREYRVADTAGSASWARQQDAKRPRRSPN